MLKGNSKCEKCIAQKICALNYSPNNDICKNFHHLFQEKIDHCFIEGHRQCQREVDEYIKDYKEDFLITVNQILSSLGRLPIPENMDFEIYMKQYFLDDIRKGLLHENDI